MKPGILKLEEGGFRRDTKAVLKHLKARPMQEILHAFCSYSSRRQEPVLFNLLGGQFPFRTMQRLPLPLIK